MLKVPIKHILIAKEIKHQEEVIAKLRSFNRENQSDGQ